MRVKNTQRQPLDIEIAGKGENLMLGPRGSGREESRELTDAEMESPDLKRNLDSGRLVKTGGVQIKPRRGSAGKDGDQ